MAWTLSYASYFVLAGGHGCGNRLASSHSISAGNAVPLGAWRRGRVFSVGWPFVLVARRAARAECGPVAAMVHVLVPLSRHATLRHSVCIPCLLQPSGLPLLHALNSVVQSVPSSG